MCLRPHGIAAQRPWRPDPDEPVPLSVFEHDADIVKEQAAADRERQVRTDFDAAVPQNDLQVYQEHKEAKDHDKTVVIGPKRVYVRSERIDTRYREEEESEPREQQREQEQAPEFRHVAVNFAARVPVRGYQLRHLRIDRDAEREGEQHEQPYYQYAFSHALIHIRGGIKPCSTPFSANCSELYRAACAAQPYHSRSILGFQKIYILWATRRIVRKVCWVTVSERDEVEKIKER